MTTGECGSQGKPAQHVHPSPEQLVRFLRGELGRSECRRIVRHLLTGCSTCVAVTAPIFHLAAALPPLQELGGTRAVPVQEHEELSQRKEEPHV
jgi:hypothetical protein